MNPLLKGLFLCIVIFSFGSVQAADLTQERWITFMTQNMPALFCKTDQYYRDCYDVTKEECEDTASFAVETCIANYLQELPDIFTYEESRKWGALIEKCVDAEYERTYGNQKKDTPDCKEIK